MTRIEFDSPTYANQLLRAQELLKTHGPEALDNPHAMIGRQCRCGQCFCCAALEVLREYKGTADRRNARGDTPTDHAIAAFADEQGEQARSAARVNHLRSI